MLDVGSFAWSVLLMGVDLGMVGSAVGLSAGRGCLDRLPEDAADRNDGEVDVLIEVKFNNAADVLSRA